MDEDDPPILWVSYPLHPDRPSSAVAYCTGGDALNATIAFVFVWLVAIVVGITYADFGVWLNLAVRWGWAYLPLMPTVLILDARLSPVA